MFSTYANKKIVKRFRKSNSRDRSLYKTSTRTSYISFGYTIASLIKKWNYDSLILSCLFYVYSEIKNIMQQVFPAFCLKKKAYSNSCFVARQNVGICSILRYSFKPYISDYMSSKTVIYGVYQNLEIPVVTETALIFTTSTLQLFSVTFLQILDVSKSKTIPNMCR